MRLQIKVVPGASRTEIVGWLGEALRIRVSAPPERGKANAAVEALLCRVLDLPAGSATIVAGGASARKVAEIVGLREEVIRQRLPSRSR